MQQLECYTRIQETHIRVPVLHLPGDLGPVTYLPPNLYLTGLLYGHKIEERETIYALLDHHQEERPGVKEVNKQ